MLSPTSATIRLFLHVLSASVWVGGQIVLGGLVPSLRAAFPESTKVAARAFNRVAWPAFAVLVVTGVWNIMAVDMTAASSEYQLTAMLHITLAVVTGLSAVVHSIGQTKLALAIGGAIGGLTALLAMFVGVLLRSGG